MRDEGAVLLDEVVEVSEPVAVLLHSESRYPPDHLPQQIHHGGDVVDLDPQLRGVQVEDLQPRASERAISDKVRALMRGSVATPS